MKPIAARPAWPFTSIHAEYCYREGALEGSRKRRGEFRCDGGEALGVRSH